MFDHEATPPKRPRRLPKLNSFIGGFGSAIALWLAWWVSTYGLVWGGIIADSPDGKYNFLAQAPMDPGRGGSYFLDILDANTHARVRSVKVKLSSKEHGIGLREGGGDAVWDPQSKFVDFIVDGKKLARLYVP